MSEKKVLNYKNKPLTRQDNTICYGHSTDKYILVMTVMETAKVQDLEVGSKVFVQVQSTRETDEKKIEVLKFAAFDSLYEAFDTGEYWLNKALDGAL